jgi:transcriptional regulator with XRE-family HTH domain
MTKTRFRVRELAEQQGISAAKLARLADVSYDTVYAIFRNEGNPTLASLEKLAAALGCKVTDLIANGDDKPGQRKAGNAQQLTQQAYPATHRRAVPIVAEKGE